MKLPSSLFTIASIVNQLAFANSIIPLSNAGQDLCLCPTATVTLPAGRCAPLRRCGPRPMCILQKVTTITLDAACAGAPTVTVKAPCPTCQKGCGVVTSTVTENCSGATLEPQNEEVIDLPITVAPTPTSAAITSAVAACYTYTSIPNAPVCPELKCPPHPHCMMLKTTTLPPIDAACPVTPVVVATPSCIPSCRDGCLTSWVTVHG